MYIPYSVKDKNDKIIIKRLPNNGNSDDVKQTTSTTIEVVNTTTMDTTANEMKDEDNENNNTEKSSGGNDTSIPSPSTEMKTHELNHEDVTKAAVVDSATTANNEMIAVNDKNVGQHDATSSKTTEASDPIIAVASTTQSKTAEDDMEQGATTFNDIDSTNASTVNTSNVVMKADDENNTEEEGATTSTTIQASNVVASNAEEIGEQSDTKNHNLLGISVHWLTTGLIDEIRELGFDERTSTIHDLEDLEKEGDKQQQPGGIARTKGVNIISPIDGKMGAAYVHCLTGKDKVGTANYILSYTWSYKFVDIVKAVADFCNISKLNPKRTYLWIDLFCINQHRVVEVRQRNGSNVPPSSDLETIFPELVSNIPNMLAVFSPWKEPKYLSRTWCLYELYTAYNYGTNVTIILPPGEKNVLEYDLFHSQKVGVDTLYHAFGQTDVENADATFQEDREMILATIAKGEGYGAVNSKVNEFLRSWIRNIINDIIDIRLRRREHDEMSTVGLVFKMGEFLHKYGELEESKSWYKRCLALCVQLFGENDKYTGHCYIDIANVLLRQNCYEEALANFRKALEIYTMVLGEEHSDTATCYDKIGNALHSLGDVDNALANHRNALGIRERTLGKDHLDTGISYSNIGCVLHDQGQLDDALSNYRKAAKIEESQLGKDHPDTATSFINIGNILFDKGDYEESLKFHQKALQIRESVLGHEHPDTASSFYNVGAALCNQGRFEEALDKCRTALAIRESIFGLDHRDTVNARQVVADVSLRLQQASEEAAKAPETSMEAKEASLKHASQASEKTSPNVVGETDVPPQQGVAKASEKSIPAAAAMENKTSLPLSPAMDTSESPSENSQCCVLL